MELQNVAAVQVALGRFASDDFVAGVLWALDTAYKVALKAFDAGEFTEEELHAVQAVVDTGMVEAGEAFGVPITFQYEADIEEVS